MKIFTLILSCFLNVCSLIAVEELVILGSGPAGLTAAIYASRSGLTPIIVEGEEPGGQITLSSHIENFPGFPEGISGYELGQKMREQAIRFGARLIQGKLESIDLTQNPFTLVFETGDLISTKSLIIAVGSEPRWLGLESESRLIGKGVSSCAVCDGPLYKNKEVVVVGGGDSAMEEALFLAELANKVTVVHRRSSLKASKYLAEKALLHPKIDFIWNHTIEKIHEDPSGQISGVMIEDVETHERTDLNCQGLFIAIGYQPNTEIFKGQLELNESGYIQTLPPSTQTSIPGVFAAGDVADSHYRQAITAAGTGCKAAIDVLEFLQNQLKTQGFSEILSLTKQNKPEVFSQNRYLIIDVYAEWCGPCRMMDPIFKELNQDYGDRYTFAKLNAGKEGELCNHYRIGALPTFLFIKEGKEVGREMGYRNKWQFEDLIMKYFGN